MLCWATWQPGIATMALELRTIHSRELGQVSENSDAPERPAEGGEHQNQEKWNVERTWGFSLEELFEMALRFFKGTCLVMTNSTASQR